MHLERILLALGMEFDLHLEWNGPRLRVLNFRTNYFQIVLMQKLVYSKCIMSLIYVLSTNCFVHSSVYVCVRVCVSVSVSVCLSVYVCV